MRIWSLGQEDPPEESMATHSSTPVWRITWERSLVGYGPSVAESDMTEHAHMQRRLEEIKTQPGLTLIII